LEYLASANAEANPNLARLALKLATGAGKTTVMAMLIAWQTVNAVRRPGSSNFTRGFIVVTPGLTVKERLRVLQPNDPDSYFASRELVPPDMLTTSNGQRSSSRITMRSSCGSAWKYRKGGERSSKDATALLWIRSKPKAR
jgi:Type III restriction enzyme, res subunit